MKCETTAARYIRQNFEATDRLAVVLRNTRTDHTLQRIASAGQMAAPDYQAWLRHKNAQGYEVYLSMNSLQEGARSRTKADIAAIRHVYLDFDEKSPQAVEQLLARPDLPAPNFVVHTSPDKCQVVWKVEGFGREQAESLQRQLVRETGADPAATDASRVLRLPGLFNHKYAQPHYVRVDSRAAETYRPEHFPQERAGERSPAWPGAPGRSRAPGTTPAGKGSQSEFDWAYAKRALARGESPDQVAAAIASYRRDDKANPTAYAERTVRKAAATRDPLPPAVCHPPSSLDPSRS